MGRLLQDITQDSNKTKANFIKGEEQAVTYKRKLYTYEREKTEVETIRRKLNPKRESEQSTKGKNRTHAFRISLRSFHNPHWFLLRRHTNTRHPIRSSSGHCPVSSSSSSHSCSCPRACTSIYTWTSTSTSIRINLVSHLMEICVLPIPNQKRGKRWLGNGILQCKENHRPRISLYIMTFHVSTGRSASLKLQSNFSSATGSSVGSW